MFIYIYRKYKRFGVNMMKTGLQLGTVYKFKVNRRKNIIIIIIIHFFFQEALCAPSEDSNQSAHPRSPFRVSAVRFMDG